MVIFIEITEHVGYCTVQALKTFCRTLSIHYSGTVSTCHIPSTVRSSVPCAKSKNGCSQPE